MQDIEKVKAVFTEILELPGDAGFESLAYRRTKGWDSNAHLRIVAALEKELGLMLSPDDIIDMENFNVCLVILRENGADV